MSALIIFLWPILRLLGRLGSLRLVDELANGLCGLIVSRLVPIIVRFTLITGVIARLHIAIPLLIFRASILILLFSDGSLWLLLLLLLNLVVCKLSGFTYLFKNLLPLHILGILRILSILSIRLSLNLLAWFSFRWALAFDLFIFMILVWVYKWQITFTVFTLLFWKWCFLNVQWSCSLPNTGVLLTW